MLKIFAAATLAIAALGAAQAPASAAPTTAAATSASTEATHEALRGLRDRLVKAVNAKDEAALLAELDENVIFTAMNNEVVRGTAEARAYYAKMLVGSGRIVKAMNLSAEADDLSTLMADGKVAVAAGSANAHFDMMGGESFEVPLRWTATLRDDAGSWKVTAIHFSANMFDNPIMSGVSRFAYLGAGLAGALGLVLGWLVGRRRKRA